MPHVIKKYITTVSLAVLSFFLTTQTVLACTGIRLKANNGDVVYARTLEFATDLQSKFLMVPRGQKHVGQLDHGKEGLSWTNKYAYAGANAFEYKEVIDGLNEKGLGFGLFYFPGETQYTPLSNKNRNKAFGAVQLGSYILGNYSSVAEVKANLDKFVVVPVFLPELNETLPAHFIIHDKTGQSLVLEYTKGELHSYDNPIGVFTNSPNFPWHMMNLRNYLSLSALNVEPIKYKNHKIVGFGQGSGMHGLPGDFTPPARFVRATAFSQAAMKTQNGPETVEQAFHILNQFDIPRGAVREIVNGKLVTDYTLWTSASDLGNLQYYFKTYKDQVIRKVDFKGMDWNAKKDLWLPMNDPKGQAQITDITKLAKIKMPS